jgi:hypothetical protein
MAHNGICNSTKIKEIIMLSLVIAMLVVFIFGIVIEIGTICVCGCVMK